MRWIFRLIALAALVWLALLFSGYGILTGSHTNVAGLGIQCSYLTARQMCCEACWRYQKCEC